ncbi:MFS transporter [Paraburkholderia sp. BCC1885]|uniref:MFS transporter n=1 Tax=Paraburkholderia sp. BCC1885 TaxID=2562669 RepID=UPI00118200F2|nr:MFS transporter [Paraburkholderia sp. BCC1885]
MHQRYRWWILGVSTLTQLAAALASQGIGAWGVYAQDVLGLSARQIGALATVSSLVPIVGLALIGPVLDRVGERMPVFLGMLVLALSMVLLSAFTGYGALTAAMLLMGAGYSPIQPGGSKAIYHWFPAQERGLAMGIRQAALPLGGACAALFFPSLISRAGWSAALVIAAGVIAGAGLIYLLVFRNAPGAGHRQRCAAPVWSALAGHFREPGLRRIALVGAMLVSGQTAVSVFWVLFVRHRFGVAPPEATWSLFVVQMSGSLARIGLSALSDHIADGRRRVVLLCLALMPVALLVGALLPASFRGLPVVVCSVVTGVFCFGWYGPWIIWLSESTGDENVGEVIGGAMAINQLAIAVTPFIFGLVADATGTPSAPLLCLCGTLGTFFAWNHLYPVSRRASQQRTSAGRPTECSVETSPRG